MPATGPAPIEADNIKLSCRNLWKVYGRAPEDFFSGGSDAPRNSKVLEQKIRQSSSMSPPAMSASMCASGEIFVIMGLSGSGKSTVIRCLSRLVEPTSGEVRLDGQDLLLASTKELTDIRRYKMGMVRTSV